MSGLNIKLVRPTILNTKKHKNKLDLDGKLIITYNSSRIVSTNIKLRIYRNIIFYQLFYMGLKHGLLI